MVGWVFRCFLRTEILTFLNTLRSRLLFFLSLFDYLCDFHTFSHNFIEICGFSCIFFSKYCPFRSKFFLFWTLFKFEFLEGIV